MVADVGLLTAGPQSAAEAGFVRKRAPGSTDSGQTFAPEDISIECAVDAEFETDDAGRDTNSP